MATPERDEAAIFNAARRIAAPEGRRRYLEQACADRPDLHARVLALLRIHDQEGSFLESPAPGVQVDIVDTLGEGPGTHIGPYRLVEVIGEGGFGVVFLAEQQEPLRRSVALKVLKPGMDTRRVVARFEAERQALALMDHPNIARILEGGETAAGRPYFVMELVYGVPITLYCDDHRLPLRERLSLFVAVCQAVQHAHQKGIIHRDLKPSNVLVATEFASISRSLPRFSRQGRGVVEAQLLEHGTCLVGFRLSLGAVKRDLEGDLQLQLRRRDEAGQHLRIEVHPLVRRDGPTPPEHALARFLDGNLVIPFHQAHLRLGGVSAYRRRHLPCSPRSLLSWTGGANAARQVIRARSHGGAARPRRTRGSPTACVLVRQADEGVPGADAG
jgi:hypothetical protein